MSDEWGLTKELHLADSDIGNLSLSNRTRGYLCC